MAKKPRFPDESETEKQVKRVLTLLKSQDEHRKSKIERIKKLIREGKYKVSAEKIAEKILADEKNYFHDN